MPILDRIQGPQDLKGLSFDQLAALAGELRARILEVTGENGGHLASNLGVVELTIALHLVYDCPKDKLIFDVGHQCYAHKLLTGRRDRFQNLRKKDGLSGFPRMEESPFDALAPDIRARPFPPRWAMPAPAAPWARITGWWPWWATVPL